MKKNISIALLVFLTLGAGAASAQTVSSLTGTDPATVGESNSTPAFTEADLKQGWYYGDTNQKKPGTPVSWVLRNTGTRSAQWYNPAIRPMPPVRKDINVARQELRVEKKDMRASTTENRAGIRTEVQGNRKQTESTMKALRASTTEERAGIRSDAKGNPADAKARMEALRASTTESRATIKDEQQKKRVEIAKKQTQLVVGRLDAAVERVQKLSDRVGAALDTLMAKAADVSVSRAHLTDAGVKLTDARAKIVAIKAAIETAFTSQTPKESLKAVDAQIKEATQIIKEAHGDVARAISSIKPGQPRPVPAAVTPAATGTATQ